MNENEFWSITGMLNWEESGDDEAVVRSVVDYLSKKSDNETFKFEELLAQKLKSSKAPRIRYQSSRERNRRRCLYQ